MKRKPLDRLTALTEKSLLASRWLMAPIYVGLAASLLVLLYSFILELLHLFSSVHGIPQNDVILSILSLIDLSLVGNLVLIVIFSGYENFVSKIDTSAHESRPDWDWQGSVDFSTLKLKLIASISAIAGINLLKVFMDVGQASENELKWKLLILVVIVCSGVLLALIDRISTGTKIAKRN